MARRLAPEVRKAELLDQVREMIATEGSAGLSLRSVARWCGMSAPGILHHFDGLKPLLEAVLAKRDAEQLAAATAYVDSLGEEGTLLDFADALVRTVESTAVESLNFDALEVEAVAQPDHPAHDYYLHQMVRPLPPALALARREYAQPDAVIAVLGVISDGMRYRWLRADGIPDYWGDWSKIREMVFAGFEPLRL